MRQEVKEPRLVFRSQAVFASERRENKHLFTHEVRKLDLESIGRRHIGTYNVIFAVTFQTTCTFWDSSQNLKEWSNKTHIPCRAVVLENEWPQLKWPRDASEWFLRFIVRTLTNGRLLFAAAKWLAPSREMKQDPRLPCLSKGLTEDTGLSLRCQSSVIVGFSVVLSSPLYWSRFKKHTIFLELFCHRITKAKCSK